MVPKHRKKNTFKGKTLTLKKKAIVKKGGVKKAKVTKESLDDELNKYFMKNG